MDRTVEYGIKSHYRATSALEAATLAALPRVRIRRRLRVRWELVGILVALAWFTTLSLITPPATRPLFVVLAVFSAISFFIARLAYPRPRKV